MKIEYTFKFPTPTTSDLQKSRHLQKNIASRSSTIGAQSENWSRTRRKKRRFALFVGAGGATSVFALCAYCAALARPEIFEFCVASGHAKFENFGPREQHSGPQAKTEVAPSATLRPKKVAERLSLRLVRLQFSLVLRIVLLNEAIFFANGATSANY